MCDDDCCDSDFKVCVAVTVVIGLLLTVILVPMSLVKVDFDEAAIFYDKVSRDMGQVTSFEGLHNVGPSGTMLTWKKTQRSIVLDNIDALTKDAISVFADLQVLFTIQTQHLRSLVDDWYDQAGHEAFVRALCLAAVRDVASNFVARSFFVERQNVQTSIQTELIARFVQLNVRADVESVQVSDIRLPTTVSNALLGTTTAQQDIQNAESERATKVQAAEIRQRLSSQQANLILINAARDVSVINQAAEQARLAETAKLVQRTNAFGNISVILNRGGDFFVQSYLRYLVMRQNGKSTVIGLE